MGQMARETIQNWFGGILSTPAVVRDARSADEIAEVLRDQVGCPSPVRAVGSNHSTTPCGVAELRSRGQVRSGTLLRMRGMDRVLHIGEDTITAEAGALMIDAARELEKRGLQFYVNVELGNLTFGSAATGGTKDASIPGELGQVGSYCVGVKMVTAAGEKVEITADDPERMRAVRGSYGLFGVVYEATFRVKRILPMEVRHKLYHLESFIADLPRLEDERYSVMMYINPYIETIVVELRRYRDDPDAGPPTRWQWRTRNLVWKKVAPYFSYLMKTYVRSAALRYAFINWFYRIVDLMIWVLVRGKNTCATDQMIRYPEVGDRSRYIFSIWAFPEERYAATLKAYFDWVLAYYQKTGYRPDMTHVGYRIHRDDSSLFSYSYRGNVLTIDPVSTGNEGWDEFLKAYNQWCSDHDGVPLFNQTNHLTREQVHKAFGGRVNVLERWRRRYDPHDRLLNDYFRELFTRRRAEAEPPSRRFEDDIEPASAA